MAPAEDEREDIRLAHTRKAGDPQDLALAHGEADVSYGATAQPVHRQHDALRDDGLRRGEELLHPLSEHLRHDLATGHPGDRLKW